MNKYAFWGFSGTIENAKVNVSENLSIEKQKLTVTG